MKHRFRQCLLFRLVHAIQEDGHQQGTDLIVRDGAIRHTSDEELDFSSRQFVAVAFLSDYVLWPQSISVVISEKHNRLCGDSKSLTYCVEAFTTLGLDAYAVEVNLQDFGNLLTHREDVWS